MKILLLAGASLILAACHPLEQAEPEFRIGDIVEWEGLSTKGRIISVECPETSDPNKNKCYYTIRTASFREPIYGVKEWELQIVGEQIVNPEGLTR